MPYLSASIVFASVDTIPTVFNLGTHGVKSKGGAFPGPGTFGRIDLSCRAK